MIEFRGLRRRLREYAEPRPGAGQDGILSWSEPVAGAHAWPGAVYFDIETWRARGENRAFLFGYAMVLDGRMTLLQELARDRAEEAILVARARDRFACADEIVTYNGTSFDLPFIRRRLHYHRLDPLPERARRVDLLHLLRKRYKKTMPDYRLTTLERVLLEKPRPALDIPGSRSVS